MVRELVKLSATNTHQSVNLEFDAEILSVINPTAQSIGISVGGNISPDSIQSADIWIPAMSGLNYPIVGRNFAVAYMLPSLVNAPTGIPTSANLFFIANESVPNFGAFPLSTLATQSLADVVLLPATNVAASGALNTVVPITPDILSITVYHSASQNLVSAFVVGVQSTIIYTEQNNTVATPYVAQASAMITSLDSSLQITAQCSAAGGDTVRVVGHRYPITPGIFKIDNPMPVVMATPPWLHAPTLYGSGSIVAPIASQAIVLLTVPATGLYLLEYSGWTYDQTVKAGLNLKISGAIADGCGVFPSRMAGSMVMSLTLGQQVTINASDFSGGAATYAYFGALRLYSI